MTHTHATDEYTQAPAAPQTPSLTPSFDTSDWIPDSLGMWLAVGGSVLAALLALAVWFIGPLVLTQYDDRLIHVTTITLVVVAVVLAVVAAVSYTALP